MRSVHMLTRILIGHFALGSIVDQLHLYFIATFSELVTGITNNLDQIMTRITSSLQNHRGSRSGFNYCVRHLTNMVVYTLEQRWGNIATLL